MRRPCFISESSWAARILTVAKFLTLTLRSIRWKAPTSAPPALQEQSRCWRLRKKADCCMLQIATWKKSWWDHRARTRWIWTLRCPSTSKILRGGCSVAWTIWWWGARIKLIGDGDLSAGIAAAVMGTGVHAVMGSGGAPEGVITAAAIRCLNGYMLGRLVIDKPELEERIAKMGIEDKKKIYEAEDLAPGKQMIFAAAGVTEGALLKGVRFFGEGTRVSSVILTLKTGRVRFIESIHLDKGPDVKVRFS